jgi:hypothetical protein
VYSALKKSAGGWEPDWEDFARKASQADLRVKILSCVIRITRPDESGGLMNLSGLLKFAWPMTSG